MILTDEDKDRLIKDAFSMGLLIHVCSGCGADYFDGDCGCPCGASYGWSPIVKLALKEKLLKDALKKEENNNE